MDLQLTGKRAVVTGGASGIGKATAALLAAEGADVVIASRSADRLRHAADEIAATSGRAVHPVPVDTSDDASVRAMAARAAELLGPVEILVNCAAVAAVPGAAGGFDAVTSQVFWDDMNVKVLGYLRCAQALAPGMIAAGWGRIINVSGLAARSAGSVVGSVRNVSVAAMTKNLADELGRHGVNVTVVHPGLTRTEATPSVVAAMASREGVSPEQLERQLAGGNTIGRMITAEEVAAIIVFLASPRSVAINGDAVACGGGAPRAIYY